MHDSRVPAALYFARALDPVFYVMPLPHCVCKRRVTAYCRDMYGRTLSHHPPAALSERQVQLPASLSVIFLSGPSATVR